MHKRETALGYLGLGILALLVILIPVIVLIPTLRFAAGVVLLLVGLFAQAVWRAARSA